MEKTKSKSDAISQVNIFAAGIDIGSRSHFVAVSKELDENPVREFLTFTADLNALADWLVSLKITTVAMESTGIYWIPVYQVLESRGLEVKLVNARHLKNVPGRKTDVLDCQWIQRLHSYGLLEGAYIPDKATSGLRTYFRHRQNLIRLAGTHVQHMRKALRQMNLLPRNVVSDITGKTGMSIIRAILQGERDSKKLAELRDKRCKNSVSTIQKSLEGHFEKECLFALKQAVELYDVYRQKIRQCDCEVEKHLADFTDKGDPKDFQSNKKKHKTKNDVSFDARKELYRITGVDLTRIDGLDENTVLNVISEVGTDMSPWKTDKHFASWLSICPRSKKSGGKNLSGKTKSSANRAAAAFRLAAFGLNRSNSALGAYFRRMKTRLGSPKAITATARKLARIFYSMLKNGEEYFDLGQAYYEEKYKERVLKNLRNRAKKFGYNLISTST